MRLRLPSPNFYKLRLKEINEESSILNCMSSKRKLYKLRSNTMSIEIRCSSILEARSKLTDIGNVHVR